MMIDTIRLSSPCMEAAETRRIQTMLRGLKPVTRRTRTGKPLETFPIGWLPQESGPDIKVEIHEMRHVVLSPTPASILRAAGSGRPARRTVVMAPCEPFITVEDSVHKLMLGHNVWGGPMSFQPAVAWLVSEISNHAGMVLPEAGRWEVSRVDVAYAFDLHPSAIHDFIQAACRNVYGRRVVVDYASGVQSASQLSSIKAYHKLAEMLAHEDRRLKAAMDATEYEWLLRQANRVMRVETTIRARKLRDALFLDRKPYVSEIRDEMLEAIHREEIYRLFHEGRFGTEPVVRTPGSVELRLRDVFPTNADRLYDTWRSLVEHGETKTRGQRPDSTFLRHRACLIDAGCAWLGADLDPDWCSIPDGFSISPVDPRCCASETALIVEKLAAFRR